MIDGAKHEIEGVNHDINGAKCQVVKYLQSFVKSNIVYFSLIQSNQIDGQYYEMDGVKHEIDGVNLDTDGANHVKYSSTLQST